MTDLPLISTKIWNDKYRFKTLEGVAIDETISDTWMRVAVALAEPEEPENRRRVRDKFYEIMNSGKFSPAGRIIAGAGTDRHVTLSNCFTMGTIPDSMDGIFSMLKEAALTMQAGGGIGYDFSTIRPKGAPVVGVGADASGPLSFMDVWDAMCRTVMSAGSRRGAMMATMRCDHPDIMDFITAKKDKARLRMFNLSVLVTDAFMKAVRNDTDWVLSFTDKHGTRHIGETVKAVDLWNAIMESTYAFAEPGVIFIDRVNEDHNLNYLETIATTNPCVPGDTPILTNEGWVPIAYTIGKTTKVWNGETYSEVTPFLTGQDQPLVEVCLSDGTQLTCTPTHEFILSDGNRVQAQNLKTSDPLEKHDFPVIDHPVSLGKAGVDPYTQGFFSGDGTQDSRGRQYIALFGPKKELVESFTPRVSVNEYTITGGYEGTDTEQTKTYVYLGKQVLHGKSFVPEHWSIPDRLEWLAGLLDSDGCVLTDVNSKSVQVSSKDREFLYRVKLMLNTLGVRGWLAEMKDCWRLCISATEVASLQDLGFLTKRLDISNNNPNRDASRFVRVLSVVPTDERDDVYCFTERKRHAGVFNGVRTGQCGEKPMGPYASCLLGSLNLVKFVTDPFTSKAKIDVPAIMETVGTAIRLMDNVVDAGRFPLDKQLEKAKADRQLGLGVTGLASALAMMRVRYGSGRAQELTEKIMQVIAHAAYDTSIGLAKEKGAFPTFEADKFFGDKYKPTFAGRCLTESQKKDIRKYGIRNGLLVSIAPTGTISLFAGNVSSGVEPIFAYGFDRKVLQPDGSHVIERVEDYAVAEYRRFWEAEQAASDDLPMNFDVDEHLPDYFTNAQELPPKDHVVMQAAAQKYVDSSISKTINVPEDISFEDFKSVYDLAYDLGCKGCTTYRPNEITGSVLSVDKPKEKKPEEITKQITEKRDGTPDPVFSAKPPERPRSIRGETYKIKIGDTPALYLTVNDVEENGQRRIFEVFLNSRDMESHAWVTGMTLTLSAIFRRPGDPSFIIEELKGVYDPAGGGWSEGRYVRSPLAAIGQILESHMAKLNTAEEPAFVRRDSEPIPQTPVKGKACPKCQEHALKVENGCPTCTNCGWSKCW